MYSSDPPIIDNNLCVYAYKYVYDSKTKDLYYLSKEVSAFVTLQVATFHYECKYIAYMYV